MSRVIERPITKKQPDSAGKPRRPVRPSIVKPSEATAFSLDQELEPFGKWVGAPLWAPPKGISTELAKSMLRLTPPFTSREDRWQAVVEEHRDQFTQVREIDLFEASIRLPKGRFFVKITEQKDFDKIDDQVPACVQTRLEEFLAGPGKARGVKVYYFKPLCVDFCDHLVLTDREDLMLAIDKVQQEVFAEYTALVPIARTMQALRAVTDPVLAVPRWVASSYMQRQKQVINDYQAKLEFKRRKLALQVARTHQKTRTDGCTFDEALALTNPLDRDEVIEHYCEEQELSRIKRAELRSLAAETTLPWFVSLSLAMAVAAHTAMVITAPPMMVADPAFVAEMPDNPGVLLKIGHFDEVDGVTHVEI